MATGFKTGGRNFQKGNKFGKGYPKLTPEQLLAKRTIESYCGKLMLAKYCIMSYDDLKKKMLDPKVPSIELMIMRIIERCISKAELHVLIWIYEKLGWQNKEGVEQDQKIFNLSYGLTNKKGILSEETERE